MLELNHLPVKLPAIHVLQRLLSVGRGVKLNVRKVARVAALTRRDIDGNNFAKVRENLLQVVFCHVARQLPHVQFALRL